MTPGASGPTASVHGLAGDRVAPDWPPLSEEDARWVARRWALGDGPAAAPVVLWRSPRPLSAAGLVRVGDGRLVFVKRHDLRVRDLPGLECEHRFARHLRERGITAPEVLSTPDGASAVVGETGTGGTGSPGLHHAVFEVHACAPGRDIYRDRESWTGFLAMTHARAAGELLARVHLAAADLELPARPFGPLVDSDEIVTSPGPLETLNALVRARPGLAAGLRPFPWRAEVAATFGSLLEQTTLRSRELPRAWTHGDWHPSNLTWSTDGQPVAVLDLGLGNRTVVVRDLAIAIERSCVSWLEPRPTADLESVRALIAGYTAVRPLSDAERRALPALTATAHVEFALSEVEYYAGVLDSPERAEVAYRDYLIGHARWFGTSDGRGLLGALGAAER
jgi:Ser/Thr protein kinase RdoA (MazF antagonist)